jgi:ABC-2 type transport system permease protein
MKTMQWLIKREFWENKGSFVWAPTILAGAMILLLFITLGISNSVHNLQVQYSDSSDNVDSGSLVTSNVNTTTDIDGHVVHSLATKLAETLGNAYMGFSLPIFLALALVIFFYCLNGLYDERRDRSILFWKSLPVSDHITIISKLVTAGVIIPLIAIGIGFLTALLALLIGCIALSVKGIHIFGLVFSAPEVYLAPIQLLAMVPIYLLWALPTLGWLMMVSSWARSKVFLWAVGMPLLSALLLWWMQKIAGLDVSVGWYMKHIVSRLLLSVLPGRWSDVGLIDPEHKINVHHSTFNLADTLHEAWMSLGTMEMWVGVIAGLVMLGVAVYMRRWREQG